MPVFLIPLIAPILPVIGPIALTGAAAGFGVGTYAIASVLAYAVTTGATLGASLLLSQPKKQKGDPQQVSVKQSLPARTRSYGRVKIAGAYAFHETHLGALYQVHVHGDAGPWGWDGVEQWWLADKDAGVSPPGGGPVSALPWGSNVRVETRLGGAPQTASSEMLAAFGSSGVWTEDHRLDGLAYSVLVLGAVKEKVFSKVYPSGVPALRVVARTAKVYDPRSGTVAFSENAALCTRDFLTNPRGFAIPAGLIDDASFAAKANIDDQAVAIGTGGTEPRYRVSFTYDLTQEPREILRTLLSSADAEIYPTADGKVGIRGGVWEEPTVTLDERHIETYRYTVGNDRLSAFNKLKLTFTHREADYQPVEIEPWEDLGSQAQVGVLQQDLSLHQVPSFTQARRLGKIFSAKGNPRHRLTLRTNLAGIIALGERCVRVRLAELDIDETFFIEKFELAGDLSGCDLQLSSLSAGAYAWSVTEEGLAPVVPPDTSVAAVPPTPTGATLTLLRGSPSIGAFQAAVRLTVDSIPGSPWTTIGRYRRLGSATWTDMTEDGDWRVVSGVLDNGATYEFQAAHAGFGGVLSSSVSAWTSSLVLEIIADPSMVNLLPHSDDPAGWTGYRVDATLGGSVAGPLGAATGRSVTFAANTGLIYTLPSIEGPPGGRTFTMSVYMRAPSGKSKISFTAYSDLLWSPQEITLTNTWQRFTKTVTVPSGSGALQMGIDNRGSTGLSDTSAGVIEIFGGMVQERISATDYKSTP